MIGNICEDILITNKMLVHVLTLVAVLQLSPDDAVLACRDMGMVLTSLETIDESFAVTNHILTTPEIPDVAYWTSGVRIYESWLWSSTGIPLNYADLWDLTEPNEPAFPGHACIHLITGKYRDSPCNEVLQFICEQECI
ncbi:hypothetical protein B566_EDAN009609 [Ephemera danica]|nr:hypothetical protein B566_EDAN009609 [Ephemera danica]